MANRLGSGDYKKLLLRIPVDVLQAVVEESDFEDLSVNAQLVQALREWVRTKRKTHEQQSPALATTP